MATAKRPPHKHYRVKRSRGFWLTRLRQRLFCPRNIIIISEHKTEHVPISIRKQLVIIALVLGFISWASYSTGNYMAAQRTLQKKDQQIASTSLRNRRVESEFALLKRDLVKMLESSKKEDLSDYARFVIEQYQSNGENIDNIDIDFDQLSETQHGAVFQRIAFLESTMEEMKLEHDRVLESIRTAARGRLKNLEAIIRTTGLNMKQLEQKAQKDKLARQNNPGDPQGGPFDPADVEDLKEFDAALYADLSRLVVLDEVVDTLPIDMPMSQNAKLTSPYGVRVDPFRKRLARHAGIDFSGPPGSKIYSTSDGVVKIAKRKGAYGLAVDVDHGLGVTTRYGHLSRILVREGQWIRRGQVIGVQGSTGRSTGAHLHYEVRLNGVALNPDNFIKAGHYARKTDEE